MDARPARGSCESLIFRKLGQELRFSWRNVVSLNQTATAIEVLMKPTGIALIPLRVFDSPEETETWMEFIQKHMTANKASHAPSEPEPGAASSAHEG